MPDTSTGDQRQKRGWEPPGHETSVNWNDDDAAIAHTTKHPTGRYGAAQVHLGWLAQLAGHQPGLAWERREVEGNPYHGNLLFPQTWPKYRLRMAAEAMALAVTLHPPAVDAARSTDAGNNETPEV
jgi:hypothetical protein